MKRRVGSILLVFAAVTGCGGGLSSAGARVRLLEVSESPPAACDLLGDVSIGVPPSTARPGTEHEAIAMMRNEAGADGAEIVVVIGTTPRNDDGERYVEARGRAYDCPEEEL